jgi:hypothetical protein
MNTQDIERCQPRPRATPMKNSPDRLLVTEDIPGASPNSTNFKTSRVSNPLNPEYKLQTVTYMEETPRKFLRDTLNVKDISEVKTLGTNLKYQRHTVKESNKINDIMGA